MSMSDCRIVTRTYFKIRNTYILYSLNKSRLVIFIDDFTNNLAGKLGVSSITPTSHNIP